MCWCYYQAGRIGSTISPNTKVKAELRAKKLLERQEHHPAAKKQKDHSIVTKLCKSLELKRAKNILFYLPINGEVDLMGIFEILKGKKKFILARVKDRLLSKGNFLDLYYVPDLAETESGAFNIPEPKKHLKKAKPTEVDLAFIPGIVFAKNGHRIGYGKGFFDRLLPELDCPKIGIAYEFQIVENVPGQPHDIPMDMIVTEKKIYRINTL